MAETWYEEQLRLHAEQLEDDPKEIIEKTKSIRKRGHLLGKKYRYGLK